MAPDVARIWRRLEVLASDHRTRKPSSYLANPDQLDDRILSVEGLTLDWSLQRVDDEVVKTLVELGDAMSLPSRLRNQFAGDIVNTSEQRSALHTAMRGTPTTQESFDQEARNSRDELIRFATSVLDGHMRSYSQAAFTDVLHIGIGGSHLGQKLLCDALASTRLNVHFLSSSQPVLVHDTLKALHPATTLVIVASKSFTTPETQQNFQFVKNWFAEQTGQRDGLARNLVLISSNAARMKHLPGQHFAVPQEIGGRFSVWSAMGLPVLLALGVQRFEQLLAGASHIDQHVLTAPSSENAAVMFALLALWNVNFIGTTTHIVLSYAPTLRWLPAYLQQLEMESLGKSVTIDGEVVEHDTVSAVWGGEETDGQHAWHQWLHQGTHTYSSDFIANLACQSDEESWILANSLAQHHVSFFGHEDTESPEKHIRGGHPSTLILLDRADARTLGMLLALYEHKVASLGYLWNINPFDQWGVERGKVIAEEINRALTDANHTVTDALLDARVRKILPRQK
ncbi:MAG: hypothetical protein J4G19_01250 [Pseudomonadales bacterium]|nr:hypothetical protein [Pseudomonadales bacterium]